MSVYWKLKTLILVFILVGQVHTEKIFGGHESVPHSRPYMALLKMDMQDGKTKHCGGFLLNEDFVMTAAHCQAKSYKVLLGVHNIHSSNETFQTISVKQAFPHKNYNATSLQNDIMLLKLSSKAKFDKNVSSIALAEQSDSSLPTSCIVSGWGRTDRNDKYMSPKLMEINITLINDKPCAWYNFYCSTGDLGPTEGDSGGPLVCGDGKAYGVVSSIMTPNSGGPQQYRYAKISDNKSWIKLSMTQA